MAETDEPKHQNVPSSSTFMSHLNPIKVLLIHHFNKAAITGAIICHLQTHSCHIRMLKNAYNA